jgi:hypothetical protein
MMKECREHMRVGHKLENKRFDRKSRISRVSKLWTFRKISWKQVVLRFRLRSLSQERGSTDSCTTILRFLRRVDNDVERMDRKSEKSRR